MTNDIAFLVETTTDYDDIGNPVTETEEKRVFVSVYSTSQTEFFRGGQSGLKPEYKMILFVGDYDGQEYIKYHDVVYCIYRTFAKDDEHIELYLSKKAGV